MAMRRTDKRQVGSAGEQGFTLLMAIFMMALFTLALAVAMPKVITDLQHDRDLETVHRGKQYIRAIKMYYKKFNAYPPTVDALVKTNNIRFLRKKYVDPTTGKDEWKPILFGQAKTQTLGFFGQPLAGAGSAGGSVLAGTGPSGGNGTTSGLGTSTTTDSSQTPSDGSQSGGTSAFGSSSSNPASSGQTFGGAGIVGFSPGGQKKSLIVWKKKDHYNEWEFVYDPLSDMQTISNNSGTGLQTPDGSSATPPSPAPGISQTPQ
jgi:type II secretory pathway pseudopilin PulG